MQGTQKGGGGWPSMKAAILTFLLPLGDAPASVLQYGAHSASQCVASRRPFAHLSTKPGTFYLFFTYLENLDCRLLTRGDPRRPAYPAGEEEDPASLRGHLNVMLAALSRRAGSVKWGL